MSRENELSLAALEGNIDTVTEILAQRCIDKDSEDMNALYNAAAQGHIEIVKLLLDYDIHVDKPVFDTSEGLSDSNFDYYRCDFTPLVKACMNNHIEVVKLLINKGASVNVSQNNEGMINHALHVACAKGNHEIIDLLLSQEEIKYNDGQLLVVAAKYSRIDTLDFLITKKGFNINSLVRLTGFCSGMFWHYNDYTVLNTACEDGAIDIIDFLLEQDSIDVTQKSSFDGWSPLETACVAGSLDAVDRLLAKFPDKFISTTEPSFDRVDSQMSPIYVAFIRACFSGNLDMINRLLMSGADVNICLAADNNILMFLINHQRQLESDRELAHNLRYPLTKVVEHLIGNTSINLYHVNEDGKTAMQLAIECDNKDAISYLEKRGIKVPENSNTPSSSSSSSSSSGYNPRFHQPPRDREINYGDDYEYDEDYDPDSNSTKP